MGSDTTHVAQTGLFFDVNEAKIAAKIGRVARGEPTSPTKSLKTQKLMLAERVGFEPTCPLRDKTLSRRPRYDHFGTSPGRVHAVRLKPDTTYGTRLTRV